MNTVLRLAAPIRAAAALSLLLVVGCAAISSRPSPASIVAPLDSRAQLPYRNVLYVSDILDSRVDIYPLNVNNPAPIGEITNGIDTPTGMAVDAAGSLYVPNNTDRTITDHMKGAPEFLNVYPQGSGSPGQPYFQDLRNPTDVVIGSDGTVYVAGLGDGYVTEYPPGSHTPSLHFPMPSGSALAVTLDAQNNLYVACTTSNAVYRFPPGSTQGTNLGLVINGEPHGIAIDHNSNLIVAVSAAPNSGSVIDVFPPGKTQPSKQIKGPFQPFMIALDARVRHLYVADYGSGNHDGGVFEFAYPAGTLVTKYVQGGASAAYGVATNPPAPF